MNDLVNPQSVTAINSQLNEPPSEPKKRGRPVGWRKYKDDAACCTDSDAASGASNSVDVEAAVKRGVEAGLAYGLAESQRIISESKSVMQDVERFADEICAKYTAPSQVLSVQINDLSAVKLDKEPCELLPWALKKLAAAKRGANWPLVYGPTGCGKTVLAEQCAQAMGIDFYHVCFTQGASESWLWGFQTANGFQSGAFWDAFTKGGLFLADELDAADGNMLLSINTALANGHAYNPKLGENAKKHENFYVIATANTNGKGADAVYTGRSRLDGATLNRFTPEEMYYSLSLEKKLCPDKELLAKLWELRAYLEDKKSKDVISTREISSAYIDKSVGIETATIFKSIALKLDQQNRSKALDLGGAA